MSTQSIAYENLRHKWLERHKESKQRIWTNHAHALKSLLEQLSPQKLLTATLGGLMLLHVPSVSPALASNQRPVELSMETPVTTPIVAVGKPYTSDDLQKDIAAIVGSEGESLTAQEQMQVSDLLSKHFDLPITANMNGISLQTNYGYIGQEQHLMLYPGDTISSHFENTADAQDYAKYGMAPGRGAWGYFAKSKASLTGLDILREQYYIALPTFLAPGYASHVMQEYDFFKYKTMIMVNPDNGKAIIVDIGDSGPSPFTGKQFGGSPEVMNYLHRVDGRAKGKVLCFFIDDNNATPLGPISIVK